MATMTVPVTVTPEASERMAEVGVQREFEEIVEHIQQTVPDLRGIAVELHYYPDNNDDTKIVIWAKREPCRGEYKYDPTDNQFIEWFVRQYPPEVLLVFVMISDYEEGNAR